MNEIVQHALTLLEQQMRYDTFSITSPSTVRDFLRLRLGFMKSETFHVIWLDKQHRVLGVEKLFQGSISECCVYPRELVKSGLACNAGACILAHNHPSGLTEPSACDMKLTKDLKNLLEQIDISVLDHMVVAGSSITSFAERGLL